MPEPLLDWGREEYARVATSLTRLRVLVCSCESRVFGVVARGQGTPDCRATYQGRIGLYLRNDRGRGGGIMNAGGLLRASVRVGLRRPARPVAGDCLWRRIWSWVPRQ